MTAMTIADQADKRTAVEVAAEKYNAARDYFDEHAENAPQPMENVMGTLLDDLALEAVETPASTFFDVRRKFNIIERHELIEAVPAPEENRRIADAIRRDLDRLYPIS